MIHFIVSFTLVVHTSSPLQFVDQVIGGQLAISCVALANWRNAYLVPVAGIYTGLG